MAKLFVIAAAGYKESSAESPRANVKDGRPRLILPAVGWCLRARTGTQYERMEADD